MRPETAAGIVELVDQVVESGIGDYPVTPAIGVYVWDGGLVGEIVNEPDAQTTIRNLEKELTKHRKAAEEAGR